MSRAIPAAPRGDSGSAEPVAFAPSELDGAVWPRFERIADRFPDRDAVRGVAGVTSYRELRGSAERVASAIAGRLGRGDGPVALMLDADAPLFSAMLASLRAGRLYAPVDPRLPDARIEAILHALGPAALVTDGDALARATRLLAGAAPVWTAEELECVGGLSAPPPPPSGNDAAYVLFTSGSTAAPKGVVQSQRNLLHNVARLSRGVRIGPADRITLLSSPSFGASVSDIFGALLNGAAVCPHSLAGDGLRRLPEWLEAEGITIFHSVASVFRSLAWTLGGGEDLSRLRMIKLGGEPVVATDLDLFRNRFPRGAVFHVGYGATEINVMRQWFAGHDTAWPGASPLGHPVDGVEIVLLDEHGRPADAEGEIGVVSDTLALGYWRDPDRTAARFVPVPGRPGLRLYRTGDLGRLLPDGCLLHLGRRDARLKVRGHRVEPAEVEGELLALPGVRESAVDARELEGGVRLVAWVAAAADARLDPAGLRRALAGRLPAAMVPAHFVLVPALPRTPGGKVDRFALPDPLRVPGGSAPPTPAESEPERGIAAAFARVLGVVPGRDDDFFELGGDSLSAVELLVELEREPGVSLSVADLLEGATPAALARRASTSLMGPSAANDPVRLSSGPGRPVFVVPGGGGDGEDLFVARRLARLAGGDRPFWTFRSGPPPHPGVDELADRCAARIRAEQPSGPYALVGECVGGVLAFAIAGRLSRAGEEVEPLVLVDAPFPGSARRARSGLLRRASWVETLRLRAAYFAARLRHHAAIARTMPGGRLRYAWRQLRVAASGLAPRTTAREREARARRDSWVATLMAWAPPPYGGPVRAIETDEGARRGFARCWSAVASGGIDTVRVPGSHTRLVLDHGEEVGAALRRWLGEPDGADGSRRA